MRLTSVLTDIPKGVISEKLHLLVHTMEGIMSIHICHSKSRHSERLKIDICFLIVCELEVSSKLSAG